MAETPQSYKEAADSLNNIVDMENALRTIGELRVLSRVTGLVDATVFAFETVLKYHEDPDGTKHIIAEVGGKVVSDMVFAAGSTISITTALSVAGGAAIADGPIPAGDVAGAFVGTWIAGKGIAVSKVIGEATVVEF